MKNSFELVSVIHEHYLISVIHFSCNVIIVRLFVW